MKNKLTPEESTSLLATLKHRFEKNKQRHKGVEWAAIEKNSPHTLKNYGR